MFRIFTTEEFYNDFEKLSSQERVRVNKNFETIERAGQRYRKVSFRTFIFQRKKV